MRMRYGGFFHGFSFGAGFELMRRVIVPAILVATPLVLWWWLGPEKPSCGATRSQAARTAVAQIVDRIHDERGDVRRATVLHFTNDPTDYITETLRARLMDSGTLDLDGTPSGEKIRSLLNLRNEGSYDVDKAIKYARERKLDAVIIGAVDLFETVKGEPVIKGNVKFIKITSGDIIEIPLTDKKDAKPGVVAAEPTIAEVTPLWQRLLYMTLLIVAIPILVFPFLKLVMRKDSNLATAGVLISLLAIDGLIISIMLGTSGTFCGLAVFLISLAAAFGYDLFMLSYAQLCRPALPGAV